MDKLFINYFHATHEIT